MIASITLLNLDAAIRDTEVSVGGYQGVNFEIHQLYDPNDQAAILFLQTGSEGPLLAVLQLVGHPPYVFSVSSQVAFILRSICKATVLDWMLKAIGLL